MVDIYSLGGLLYFLLTGRAPFNGADIVTVLQQVIGTAPLSPRSLNPRVPAELEAVCLKCLHKDPQQRYPSAAAVAAALGNVASTDASRVQTGNAPVPAPTMDWKYAPLHEGGPTRHRRRLWLAGVALLVLAGLGTLLWNWPALHSGPASSRSSEQPPKLVEPESMRRDFGLQVKLIGGVPGDDGVLHLVERDRLKVSVKPDRDAYVGIWSVDANGPIVQLFPNKNEPDPLIKAGQEKILPNRGEGAMAFPTVGPGVDRIWVAAVTEPWEPTMDRPEGDFQRFLTEAGRKQFMKVRGVRTMGMAEELIRFHVAVRKPSDARK